MKTIKIIVPTILYAGMLLPCMAQSSLVDSIQDRFKDQLMLFPQEKLYLHTDKSAYIAEIQFGFVRMWSMQLHTFLQL